MNTLFPEQIAVGYEDASLTKLWFGTPSNPNNASPLVTIYTRQDVIPKPKKMLDTWEKLKKATITEKLLHCAYLQYQKDNGAIIQKCSGDWYSLNHNENVTSLTYPYRIKK